MYLLVNVDVYIFADVCFSVYALVRVREELVFL